MTKPCPICGRQFEPKRSWHHFCSDPCRMKHHANRAKVARELMRQHEGSQKPPVLVDAGATARINT